MTTMSELARLIDQVSREKGIEKQVLIGALEEAIATTIRKKLGSKAEILVRWDEEKGEIEAVKFYKVVDEVKDPNWEMSIEEATKYAPEAEVGDEVGISLDPTKLGRIAAQTAKQIILQRLRDAERDAVYEEFKHRRGEIIHGVVQRVDKTGVTINLGKAEAFLPVKEQIPQDNYRPGDRVRAYILEVKKSGKGPQIIVSRTHPSFLIQLFALEVPEIQEGIVSIIAASREPGSRAKIAVVSKDPSVDPIGACVGVKGNRVQKVVQELRGERIDIIQWNVDPAKFVVNALAPAVISKVIIDQANQAVEVIVPDDQLSLAIGKRGQNVRLAAKLTNWKIDVTSETRYERRKDGRYQEFFTLQNMTEDLVDMLFDEGITSLEEFVNTDTDYLESIMGLSKSTIEGLKTEALNVIRKRTSKG
ncbi:MAG: transcription termination factor NusA [Thermodesulforhabdaceae bacterium]